MKLVRYLQNMVYLISELSFVYDDEILVQVKPVKHTSKLKCVDPINPKRNYRRSLFITLYQQR